MAISGSEHDGNTLGRLAESPVERRILLGAHKGLLWILIIGFVGLEAELLLLKHTEGFWQIVPLVLLALGLVVTSWYAGTKSAAAVKVLTIAMVLFLASGAVGTFQHLQGNIIYEQESNPGLGGRELYVAAVQGSTPTLAPGAMVQLGLLGLVVAFCGSRLRRVDAGENFSSQKRPES